MIQIKGHVKSVTRMMDNDGIKTTARIKPETASAYDDFMVEGNGFACGQSVIITIETVSDDEV